MQHGSRRQKARRLQVEVAEILARRFKLTIEAAPPTKPGVKKKIRWVREDEKPDLRVRTMGQAGADVGLLSEKAKRKISLFVTEVIEKGGGLQPIWFEVKNVERWSLDATFWRKGILPTVMSGAYNQAKKSAPGGWRPIAVVGKNYMPPLAIWRDADPGELDVLDGDGSPMVASGPWVITPFEHFVRLLNG